MPKAEPKTRTFPTRIDLPAEKREALAALLNQSLADVFDLYSQTKQAHWNVKGKDFYQLHVLFDEIAAELLEFSDEIAERVTALGGYATGTVRMSAGSSTLPEFPPDAVDGMACVAALSERFAHFGGHVRQAIDESDELGDQGTADLYTEVIRTVDKRLWFLEAHLQGRE
jgi:starvation-inducible DNA-binding protein